MGGTSVDVALVADGTPTVTTEGEIGGHRIAAPVIDIHTIGAGGGSIAWIDTGGLLAVGPKSAGADPGPACYGRGGRQPTVTDADLLLGRIPAEASFPGLGTLDIEAARRALKKAGVDAAGVVTVADAAMVQAARALSVPTRAAPR